MSHEARLRQMEITELAENCERETNNYFNRQAHDTSYCFELFRRAIQEGSKAAWEYVSDHYQSLVVGWVKQHPSFVKTGEEVQYFVNGVFGKIYRTLSPDKFSKFTNLGSLLLYLKMCVHSVIMDYLRADDYADLHDLDDVSEEPSLDPSPEEQAIDNSSRQMLWDLTRARLHDEKERVVIHGSFVLDLKPQEMMDLFPGVFSGVDEIYRVKQNVVSRLRRDVEFGKLLHIYA